MDWVLNYFQTQAARWHGRATAAGGGGDDDELDLGDRTLSALLAEDDTFQVVHRCYALVRRICGSNFLKLPGEVYKSQATNVAQSVHVVF